MLKSILTTAFRSIFRNRSFSLINLVGLSVSMSLGMLIILVVKEQYTFDDFHPDADRIYRINTVAIRTSGEREPYASSPLPLGAVLEDDYTFSEDVIRLTRGLSGDVAFENVTVPLSGLFADASFLRVFNFPLERGNAADALDEPNRLVITQESAAKIFGKQDPMGQTVTIRGYSDFVVTGVLQKPAHKTHFEFEMLASSKAIPSLEKAGILMAATDNWNNYYRSYNYLKLQEGRSITEVENALSEISKVQYARLKLETRDRAYEFQLQPLGEITPGPMLSNQMGRGLPALLIVFMSVLAGVVIVMACFNYTNLMIAKGLSRAREIGIRKVVGARKFQVFFQFIGESIVFALAALVCSYLILQLLLPAFLQLHIANEFSMNPREDIQVYLYFLLFAMAVGLVAGLLPAGYFSSFKPALVLKDAGAMKVYSRFTIRKILMVSQFTLSLVFVIVVMVIYRQIEFMITSDYGIDEKNIVNVRLQGLDFQKLANELNKVQGVERIGGVSHALGTWADGSSDYRKAKEDEPFVIRDFMVDANYITNINLHFLAGKNFDDKEPEVRERSVILNERALRMFNFSDPASAVGQVVYADDSIMLTVVGVVKDFHFRPLSYEIGPLALRNIPSRINILSVRITPHSQSQVTAALDGIWKKMDPNHTLEWSTMEQEIDQAYIDAGFNDVLSIVGYISFLTITLACLGMLGMAMYSSQTRIKEIGIRKVMGASVSEIIILLSRSFVLLIGLAIVIGVPMSFLLSNIFLETYAYRIEFSAGIVLTGVVIIILLGTLIICSQTIKAAISNPVKSLRYE